MIIFPILNFVLPLMLTSLLLLNSQGCVECKHETEKEMNRNTMLGVPDEAKQDLNKKKLTEVKLFDISNKVNVH